MSTARVSLRWCCGWLSATGPVVVSVDESAQVGCRIRLENAGAIGTELVLGDDIAGVCHARDRVLDGGHLAAVEYVARVQQFAEIALTHKQCGDGQVADVGKAVTHPLLAPIPEDFVLLVIELAGDVEGTAHVVAELVVVDGSGELLPERVVACPGVRIENVVTDVVISRAMELVGAAAGENADLAAGGASEFHRVGRGEDLDFLRGIHVGGAQAGPVGTGARRQARHRR